MWPTMAHTDADLVKDNLAQARPSGHRHIIGHRHRGTEAQRHRGTEAQRHRGHHCTAQDSPALEPLGGVPELPQEPLVKELGEATGDRVHEQLLPDLSR